MQSDDCVRYVGGLNEQDVCLTLLSREIENSIIGRRLDESISAKAAEAAMMNARPLAQNDYKIPLFRGMIEEELLAARKAY